MDEAETRAEQNAWRDRFADVAVLDKSGSWTICCYQEAAVNRVLEKAAAGKNRILLTLATGTGETSIAFPKTGKARGNRAGLRRLPEVPVPAADRGLTAKKREYWGASEGSRQIDN